VVEGAPLLREYTRKGIEGSNPFLSAIARCGTADYMSVKVKTPSAGDYGHLTIRRLLRIRSVSEWGNRLLGDAPVSGKTPKRL
jgi:hypothetical protein